MNFNNKKPLIMDGAMGTELMRRGIELPLPLWSAMANIDQSKHVTEIHEDYIESGSNVITTNTFRTTPRTFIKAGYSDLDSLKLSKQAFKMAVKAARDARNDKNILIAGSIAPLEDCYVPSKFPGSVIAKKNTDLLQIWFLIAVWILCYLKLWVAMMRLKWLYK